MTEKRFAFGKNWANYVETSLSEQQIHVATQALQDLLGLTTLEGRTFLDIGCGSGLHSLAAFRLGAKQIISFDYDSDSVKTTEKLRGEVGNPAHWTVFQGSILDPELVAQYRADIVYSWGVLHHTGNMWQAIRNAGSMVNPGGLFCIAIYNRMDRWLSGGSSAQWAKIKHYYVNSPAWRKALIIQIYKIHFILTTIFIQRKNPFKYIRSYGERGMNWHYDVIDWVGGYPFEYASPQEVTDFCSQNLRMTLLKSNVRGGHGCNEFTFQSS